MLEAKVKVCGIVAQQPVVDISKKGNQYITFGVNYVFANYNKSETAQKFIKVIALTANVPDYATITVGKRVEIQGTARFRKVLDQQENVTTAIDLIADSVNQQTTLAIDVFAGTLHMIGKLGDRFDPKISPKNGKPYLKCSAYLGEQVKAGQYEYHRVFLTIFNCAKQGWMDHKAGVEFSGLIEVGAYKGDISLSCNVNVKDIKMHSEQPDNGSASEAQPAMAPTAIPPVPPVPPMASAPIPPVPPAPYNTDLPF
ncbi:MAG: single-stranded DNA-binding protein [Bacteroidales bacterium]|nr:single-stranded DNA-binding protein [Bacteroidales bacterium]